MINSEAKRYITLYRQLQKIREQRHLSLIGEEGEEKTRYKQMLEFIDSNYSAENEVDSAKNVCKLFFQETKEHEDSVR